MTISEAIKYIISKQDDSILLNSKKIMEYLRELLPEESEGLQALENGISDRVLEFFFKDNALMIDRITKIRSVLEKQGVSEKCIDFIIDSFSEAFNLNMEKNKNNNVVDKQIDNLELDFENISKQELENLIKSKVQEIKEVEENIKNSEENAKLLKIDLEDSQQREKDLKTKYNKITAEKLEIERDLEESSKLIEETMTRVNKLKTELEHIRIEHRDISDNFIEFQLKARRLKLKYYQSIGIFNDVKILNSTELLIKKLKLEELILRANYGEPESQYNLAIKYEYGEGVTQDHEKAVKWYKRLQNREM